MNKPEEKPVVTQWLEKYMPPSRNLLFDSGNTVRCKRHSTRMEAGPEVPYHDSAGRGWQCSVPNG